MKKIIIRAFAVVFVLATLVSSALCVSAATKTYTDVKSGDWFTEYVNYMSDKGIINGYTDNTFRSNNEVKRSEFIKMMVETFGIESEASINYSDVSSGDWYYSYYRKAAAQGFTTEVFQSSKTMLPSQPLQRQEAAALLMAYLSYPEDKKASSSTFTDYSSIKSDYRDWVLQAVDADIINGFTDSTFRPTATLTRAQAAKILAVAAGTIADGNDVNKLESFSENLTVTGPCTVQGVTIKGDVIISEGITNGAVYFVGCTINGTVYDRSNASVVFNGGYVNELNINALGASVTLKSDVNIDALNINEYSTVTLTSANLYSVKAAENAKKATVSGTGTIKNLDVKAEGFVTSIVPSGTVTVSGDITTTIGDASYSGGFVGGVRTIWLNDQEYIEYETYREGKVRYYFTTSATAPSKTSFDENYLSASYRDEFNVVKKDAGKKLLSSAATIKSYPYLVVALVEGTTVNTPTVIDRAKMHNAFTVAPTLSVSNANEQLRFAARQNGTVYYYYTQDSEVPATFLAAYSGYNDAYLKGTIAVSSTATTTKTIQLVSEVDAYGYIVVFFKGTGSEEFLPVIVERSETASGFKTDTEWVFSDKDNKYKMTFVLSKAGTIKYLYTNLSSNFTAASFEAEYNRLVAAKYTAMYGTTGTLATTVKEYKLARTNAMYLVAMFVESNGVKYSPIKMSLKMSGTGFSTDPVVYTNSVQRCDYFSIITEKSGSVRGMYIEKNQAFTTDSFAQAFATALSENKFEYAAIENVSNNVVRDIPTKNYAYIAFMFVSNEGNSYNPVVVSKKSGGTGFNGTPVITATADIVNGGYTTVLSGKAYTELKIAYFGENDTKITSQITSDTFDRLGQGGIKYTEIVSVADLEKGVQLADLSEYKYVVIRATLECGTDVLNFAPIVLNNNKVDYGVEVSGLTLNDGNVQVNLKLPEKSINGKLTFCFANSIPKTAEEFRSLYSKAPSTTTGSAIITLSTTEFLACRLSEVVDFKYIVYLFEGGMGTYMPYYANNVVESELQVSAYIGVVDYKLVFKSTINNYRIAWFYSKSEVNDMNVATFKSMYNSTSSSYRGNTSTNSDEQFIGTISVPKQDSNKVYLYFCVIDAQNSYYKPVKVILPTT